MQYTSMPQAESRKVLAERLSNAKSSCWIGAFSFEDRCLGSVQWLQDNGLKMDAAVGMEYPTVVKPAMERRTRSLKIKDQFRAMTPAAFRQDVREVIIEPYAFQAVKALVIDEVKARGVDFAVVDLSCMTKVHAMGIAAGLCAELRDLDCAIAYSSPDNYSNLDAASKRHGWRDIIVAPIADSAVLRYEVHSRGIVVAGHESDRLTIALSEIEPSGGVVVYSSSSKRPDLAYLSEQVNRRLVRQLVRRQSSQWKTLVLNVGDIDALEKAIEVEIAQARTHHAPVILFPIGPKSLVFFGALTLCEKYPEASWFVYPVPAAYDVNYSEGVSGTSWFFRF